MGVVEFELARVVHAPIDDVFARLADINGYDEWMPRQGSIRRHSEQTSPDPSALGTTYVDRTLAGRTPGEIAEYDRPTRLVFHWWDKSKRGKVHAEGWPAYRLEAKGDHTTLVHHHVKLETHGVYRAATPLFHWMAVRERTTTVEALQASFGHHHDD
ncbi:hypothetical protein N802_05965 [Knoellia sinensis KCTC 19936]|uniref:Polyketide cyclase n=1 Tax=Knoellia sinensis KCTC 19936 TaxID=1385520 RepID=A0A0A0IZX7_9MICO|nr:SRPBCC family protein [Knoellia sinensis]KGN30750.1 hypothetical protein N802_05965 [Knoellia sinensis KCTC 19936]